MFECWSINIYQEMVKRMQADNKCNTKYCMHNEKILQTSCITSILKIVVRTTVIVE